MVKATLNDYRQSPRKVRLVANLIKGKNVDLALATLAFTVKDASSPIKKLIESAIANAKNNFNLESSQLFVKEISVNAGPVLKRSSAGTRGSAMPIKKRTSHVDIVLDIRAEKVAKKGKKGSKEVAKVAVKGARLPESSEASRAPALEKEKNHDVATVEKKEVKKLKSK